MNALLRILWRDDGGQDLVEYALLVVLLALAAIAGVTAAGHYVGSWYDAIHNALAAL